MSDPNSLTMDKLMEAWKSVERIPTYEVRLEHSAVGPFNRYLGKLMMPLGPAPSPHPVVLGGIPVVMDPYMPEGMGVMLKKTRDGLPDVVMIFKVVGQEVQCFQFGKETPDGDGAGEGGSVR